MYGPTGDRRALRPVELLQTMAPWEGGGSMIATVSLTERHHTESGAVARGRHARYRDHRPRRGKHRPTSASWTDADCRV
ncbi:hypothetical protein MJ585_16575 [Klebsiella pneumoniae]|nr:hypothetical protein MJ585_16575 [Klebsiella pneumoniae]